MPHKFTAALQRSKDDAAIREILNEVITQLDAAVESYRNDPADSNFQRGYLAALKWMQELIDAHL